MAGPSDVVRHVILRISVDQAGLAEELAAARAKLKALKDSEKETNRDRSKSADEVTKAVHAQNEALDKNREAHDAANRAAGNRGKTAAENIKAESDALKENTAERKRQTVEEARADAIRQDAANKAAKAEQSLAAQKAKNAAADTQRVQDSANRQRKSDEDAVARAAKLESQRKANDAAQAARDRDTERRHSQSLRDALLAEQAKQRAAAETSRRRDEESAARVFGTDSKNADADSIRRETYDDRLTAQRTTAQSQTTRAQEQASSAQSSSAAAASREQAAADNAAAAATTRRNRALSETQKLENDLARASRQGRLEEEKIAAAAEARARATERAARADEARRQRSTGMFSALGNVLVDTATLVSRSVTSAPRAARAVETPIDRTGTLGAQRQRLREQEQARQDRLDPKSAVNEERQLNTFAGRLERVFSQLGKRVDSSAVGSRLGSAVTSQADRLERRGTATFDDIKSATDTAEKATSGFFSRFRNQSSAAVVNANSAFSGMFRRFRSLTEDGEKSFGRFIRSIPHSADEASQGFFRMNARLEGFIKNLNRPRGDSGTSLLTDLARNFDTMQQRMGNSFQNVTRRLISFRSLVVAVVAALGPLAAILGGLGAAALGLASNIGALVGVLGALPGILTAAVAGFGALALVMKPITSVFTAYSAAQKASIANTNAAKDASIALREAVLQQSQAQLTLARAQADKPRAQTAYNDAVKEATRNLEDYRDALKKLQYDEEGASLGVESAQLAYRKSLVDPTATKLDRATAQHDLQGAYFDQQDQAKNAQRTREDAAEAQAKGVAGADNVVAADRAREDAANAVTAAVIAEQKAELELAKARLANAAGSTEAAAYQAALKKLPPETRKVVEAILGLQGAFKKMRDQLSENIFGKISGDTGKFAGVLKSLGDFLTPASTAIGYLAKRALDLFTNPDWKKFFTAQGNESGYIIKQLGVALLDVADGFRAITEEARPFTRFIVDGIGKMAEGFKNFATSDAGRKSISDFLSLTKKRMQELGPVLGNLVGGFVGFFKALNKPTGGQDDFTTYFNKGLGQAAKTFNDLGKRAQDPNGGFQKWLRDVRPLLHDTVTFLSQAAGFFGDLFKDNRNMGEARNILKEIGSVWLPQLADLFGKLASSGLISKLANAIGSLFTGASDFFDHGGISAISAFVTIIEAAGNGFQALAGWIDKITTAVPILGSAISGLGTIIAVLFAAALVAKLTHIFDILKGIGSLGKGIVGIVRDLNASDDDPAKSKTQKLTETRIDRTKDKLLGLDAGTSTRRRQARQDARDDGTTKPSLIRRLLGGGTGSTTGTGSTGSGQPQVDLTGTGDVLPHLSRMELLLQKIEVNTRRSGGATSGSTSTGGDGGGVGGSAGTDDTTKSERTPRGKGRGSTRADPNFTIVDEASNRSTSRVQATGTPALGTSGTQRALPAAPKPTPGSQLARKGRLKPPVLADVGDDLTAYTGLDDAPETYTKPAKRPQTRNSAGQFGETGSSTTAQTRSTGGQFGSKPKPTIDDIDVSQVRSTKGEQSVPSTLQDAIDTRNPTNLPVPVGDVSTAEPRHTKRSADIVTKPAPGRGKFRTVVGRLGSSITSGFGALGSALAPSAQDVTTTTSRPTPRRTDSTTVLDGEVVEPTTAAQPSAAHPSSRRTATTGVPGANSSTPDIDILSDILNGGDGSGAASKTATTKKPGFLRRTLNFLGKPLKNDSGSVGLGIGTRDKTTTKPSRLGKLGKGFLGGLGAVGSALLGTGLDTVASSGGLTGTTPIAGGDYDDGYTSGYDDALSQAGGQGGSLLDDLPDFDSSDDDDEKAGSKNKSRKERRAERKAARRGGVSEPLEGEVLTSDEYESLRRSRSTTVGEDESTAGRGTGGRSRLGRLLGRGAGTEIESVAKGAGRFGRVAGGLGRLGGGLARGVAGGLGGLALSAAMQFGGDALLNNFVKNDDDRSSLSRGLGAVSTGAGIGSMIGSVIPGVGTVIGGAVGGLAGGAYSLFKDKNLRDFVGDKLGGAARGVGGAVSGAAKGVGNFLGGVGGSIKDLFSGKDSGAGGAAALALGPIGLALSKTDIGKSIIDSLNKAGSAISNFFTKTIPGWFDKGGQAIITFFLKTLPSLPGKAFDAFFRGVGRMIRFFKVDLPNAANAAWDGIKAFFTVTLPGLATQAWRFVATNLWDPFVAFVKAIPGFFTQTIPLWFKEVGQWERAHIVDPMRDFVTKTIPNFFTQTIPHWFETVPGWFKVHVIDPMTSFFTTTLPGFFTTTLPNAIAKLPGFIYSHLVQPVLDFFGGLKDHVADFLKGSWDWAKSVFNRASNDVSQGEQGKMSGGLITGVYQGIEDTVKLRATPDEFVVRRSKVIQPGGKAFLDDFNEGRITPSMFYGGLDASMSPRVMSIVPPDSAQLTGAVSKINNTTINHAPVMGDVTINNPVREKSEHSLRRQVQIANIRHRR